MLSTLTYSPILHVPATAGTQLATMRRYARYAEIYPLQPLKGHQKPCAASVSYRASVPSGHAGCGLALSYRASSPDGESLPFGIEENPSVTSAPTANYSLLTADWTYTFSAKEKDSETGLSYFGSRYYSSDLSIWLSVDPMSDKYASLSPYVYCADNPVKLVDPNGEEIGPIWPKRGIRTYSWKLKAGVGDGFGVAYSIMGGVSYDKHGKTHWIAQNYKYIVNQNLYDSSPNPAIEIGVDMGGSLIVDLNWQYDSFIDALNSSILSISPGGIERFHCKGLVGLTAGVGDNACSFGVGVGLSLGISSDPYFIIESISISKEEESSLNKIFYSNWTVIDQKYNEQTNTFQGTLKVGNEKTNIKVSCSAVDINGIPKPNGIWASDDYLR